MKQIKKTVKRTIDYILDPSKMGEKALYFGQDVKVELADLAFSMTRDAYLRKRPNRQKHKNENLALHLIQSHKKTDPVTPEMAFDVAKKTAKAFTKDDYQYVLAVHTDKDHLHAHIIVNTYSHRNKTKLSRHGIVKELVDISNHNCLEYGLSTSEIKRKNPNERRAYPKKESYQKVTTQREKLMHLIDEVILHSNTFTEFLEAIKLMGIEVKQNKNLSFKLPDSERFIRITSLDEHYQTIDILKSRIELEPEVSSEKLKFTKSLNKDTRPWIDYYAKDYWKHRSQDLSQITLLSKMLIHMNKHDIQVVSDYVPLIKGMMAEIEKIKHQTTIKERQYDSLVGQHKGADKVVQLSLETQMVEIRSEIKVLNHKYVLKVEELKNLEQFRQMMEKAKKPNQKKQRRELRL